MKFEEIQAIQKKIGVLPDGVFGPKSRAALKEYLRKLGPAVNPWPRDNESSLRAFYGEPGDESNLVAFEPPFPMFYDGKQVKTLRCHKKVKDSLLRILTAIGKSYGGQRGVLEEAEDYGGCFNFRPKRGRTTGWSLHAWGAAIDLDADDNTFKDTWPQKADMPLEVIEEFAKEGWLSAAAAWGYDAMHFQATA